VERQERVPPRCGRDGFNPVRVVQAIVQATVIALPAFALPRYPFSSPALVHRFQKQIISSVYVIFQRLLTWLRLTATKQTPSSPLPRTPTIRYQQEIPTWTRKVQEAAPLQNSLKVPEIA